MNTRRPSESSTPDPHASGPTPEQRAQAGCRESFRVLVERHQRGVTNLVRRRLTNAADVDEVSQEAFLQAWKGIQRYNPRQSFSTWLYTIAFRCAASHARRCALRATVEPGSELEEPAITDPAHLVETKDQAQALWKLAETLLSADQRAALWLCYAEGYTVHEISSVLERSTVAVRLLLHRARRRLAKHSSPASKENVSALPPKAGTITSRACTGAQSSAHTSPISDRGNQHG